MKFAVLALLGVVSAQEETELMGKMWRWEHVPEVVEAEMKVWEDLEDIGEDLEEHHVFEKIGKKFEGKFEKYIPELEAWGRSDAVLKKKAHEKAMMRSKGRLQKAFMSTGIDAMNSH